MVRLGIMTLDRCQVVALEGFNPSMRMLTAVKLMDAIVDPLGSIRPRFPLEERPATVVNKMPFFSLICDECDIFAAARSGCPWSFRRVSPKSRNHFRNWRNRPETHEPLFGGM